MRDRKMKIASFAFILAFFLQFMTACASNPWNQTQAAIHPVVIQKAFNEPQPTEDKRFDETTLLTVKVEDEMKTLTLKEYLIGVLHGELPADFSLEAMKAQAVAARTVAVKKMLLGSELCDDPSCCQAYVQPVEVSQRVLMAVEETEGEVLIYQQELIEATYFSCSGGMTESAADVWGNEVAYLQALASPGEESAPRFEETITIPFKVFLQTLRDTAPEIEPDATIGEAVLTAGGGVKTIEIGGIEFSGLQLRSLFSLRSTSFEINRSEHSVSFHCSGYGHRVGMSQYGAQAMAERGDNYRQILAYYYPGTEIKKQS